MKKIWKFALAAVCLASLSGCESMTRAIRGDEYVDAKIQQRASESSSKQYAKDLQKH